MFVQKNIATCVEATFLKFILLEFNAIIHTHNYFIPIHVETVSNNIPCKYEHKNLDSMVQYEYIVMLLHATEP